MFRIEWCSAGWRKTNQASSAMANFKIALALLSVALIVQRACAVVNEPSGRSTSDRDGAESESPVVAEDRIISEVYGAPPVQPSNGYGSPSAGGAGGGGGGGGGFNGPAPVYGPPELTGHRGPVRVHPPPPPELPPPPPPLPAPSRTHGPPRKPKPHYGPPKTAYGPPAFGPKPIHGPPKLHHGPANSGPPKPQYGVPFQVPGPSSGSNQLRPAGRFEAPKNIGLSSIPISLEQYGPPSREASFAFAGGQRDFALSGAASISPVPINDGSRLPGGLDSYGPPPPPPAGVPAPPTPPDIKYDGWQPIPGLVGTPDSGDSGQSHNSLADSSGVRGSSVPVENPIINNVPSNSYGEPILNQDAQHFKTSVYLSTNSHGLPPPPLPQSEPIHTDQGLTAQVHREQQQSFDSSLGHDDRFGNSGISIGHFEHSIVTDSKTPGFEVSPEVGALADSPGFPHGDESGSSFGGSGGPSSFPSVTTAHRFHGDLGSSLSLPGLSLETDGTFSNGHGSRESLGFRVGVSGDDPSVQRLPVHGPAPSFTGNPGFGSPGHGQGKPRPVDSYGAPPASSYSPNGRYPGAQGPRGGSWHSEFVSHGSSSFEKQRHHHHHHQQQHHHYHHRGNNGPRPLPPPPRYGPPLSIPGNLVPPRNRAPVKFREQIPIALLAKINRYLPPISKPSINHGGPMEQQLPSSNGAHSFESSSSANSFGGSFGTSDSSLVANAPIAAPHVLYGTPLSFGDFNTPAPVRTYGAPNFAPANSFVSTSFGDFGSPGSLYKDVASDPVTATYGTPVNLGSSINGVGPSGLRDCTFDKSGGQFGSLHGGFLQDAGHFTNLIESGEVSVETSSGHGSADQHFGILKNPSIHELDLESHERQEGQLRDSYGNPIVGSSESVDQAGAALTNADVRANSVHSSRFVYSSHENGVATVQSSHEYGQSSGTSFSNGGGISAEALTAALTAEGFGHPKNYASNEILGEPTTRNRQNSVEAEGNEALALALRAEGADDFQIQGSKGTYTLQIQSANGSPGTENSDGSVRHDEVLSNGLLRDILAAIERPNDGPVRIEGPPQPQQLQRVYDDSLSNGAHRSLVGLDLQNPRDALDTPNEIVRQVLSVRSDQPSNRDVRKSLPDDERVALFYDDTGAYENSKKDTGSTSKSDTRPGSSNGGARTTDDPKISANGRDEPNKNTS